MSVLSQIIPLTYDAVDVVDSLYRVNDNRDFLWLYTAAFTTSDGTWILSRIRPASTVL